MADTINTVVLSNIQVGPTTWRCEVAAKAAGINTVKMTADGATPAKAKASAERRAQTEVRRRLAAKEKRRGKK